METNSNPILDNNKIIAFLSKRITLLESIIEDNIKEFELQGMPYRESIEYKMNNGRDILKDLFDTYTYTMGGIVGHPDGYQPEVLSKGEEVLTEYDPRHVDYKLDISDEKIKDILKNSKSIEAIINKENK